MKRRDFVTYTAGALAAGSAGCTGMRQLVVPSSPQVTAGEMEEFLLAQDAVMSRITAKPDGGGLLGELAGGKPLQEDDARLFRGAMGSLLIAGNMRDLPVAGQVHPGVQKRLRHAAPMMNSTLTEFIDGMKSMTPTARADLRSALRSDPELGTRILEAIDRETAAAGAPARRRTELLQLGDYVIGRLTHSPDLLMDEYVDKYEQQTAREGSAAQAARVMAARLGRSAFQARVREAETAAGEWERVGVRDIPIGYTLRGIGGVAQEAAEGEVGMSVLGVGVIITAAGWLLILLGNALDSGTLLWPGVVGGVTVGPVVMIVGLVMGVAEAARNAS